MGHRLSVLGDSHEVEPAIVFRRVGVALRIKHRNHNRAELCDAAIAHEDVDHGAAARLARTFSDVIVTSAVAAASSSRLLMLGISDHADAPSE